MDTPCIHHTQKGSGTAGYGVSFHEGRNIGSHVRALIIHTGEQPNGRVCMHECDNPRCVNPLHLKWGTQKENMADCKAKGRWGMYDPTNRVRGESHGCAKLTREQVESIRQMHSDGYTRRELREIYSVSKTQIQRIVTGEGWKNE